MFAMLATFVCVSACIVACVWRMARVFRAARYDPAMMLGALDRWSLTPAIVERRMSPHASWDRQLVASLSLNLVDRTAELRELALDYERHVTAFARLPRVCASVSATTGFFFGVTTMMSSAASDVQGKMPVAIACVALGLGGTVWAIATQRLLRTQGAQEVRDVYALLDACEGNAEMCVAEGNR